MKKPIDIAVELDISYSKVFELQQEYFALKETVQTIKAEQDAT
jgi:hypothetical protein